MPNFSQYYETKTLKLKEKIESELQFVRDHPFLENWNDWQETVKRFHSIESSILGNALVRGSRSYQPFINLRRIIDYVYWDWPLLAENNLRFSLEDSVNKINYDALSFWDCECEDLCFDLYDNDCKYARDHLIAHLLSLLHSVLVTRKIKKRDRKYYKNLQKVIFSLSYDKLCEFDIALIDKPPSFPQRGRALLKQLYERGYLDKLDLSEIPFAFERLKHAKQQGGASQSGSAFISDEIVSLANKCFGSKEQMFSFNHNVSFNDDNFKKIKDIVVESQEKFVSSLQGALVNSGKKITVLFLLASTAAILGKLLLFSSVYVVVKLLNFIYNFLFGNSVNIPKQQGDSLSIPFLPALILKNVVNPPAAVLSTLWKSNQTDLVMRRIGYLGDPKIAKGLESAIEWVSKLVFNTVNWYREAVLGLDPIEDIDRDSCAVLEWHDQVDDIVKKYYAGDLQYTESTWLIMNLYSRGLSFTRQPIFSKFKADVWKVVIKLGNILEKFSAYIRGGNKVRNPPVTIYISGDSGVGKSSLTYPLAAEILNNIFKKEGSDIDLSRHWESMIYMRSPEQEFWDGYDNQLVTVFDDFNQLVDSSANPNLELFEIIRASNCFPYPLHMASLDQKANTTFNSKIIIVSSNLEAPKTASLNFPTALERRFDICVKISRKPNFEIKEGVFDPELYDLQLYDMKTKQYGDFMSYKDLIFLTVSKYFKNKSFVNSIDNYVKNIFKSPQQQGVGTLLGWSAKKVIEGVASTGLTLISLKHDFQAAWYGDEYVRLISELKIVTSALGKKRAEISSWWASWKLQHPYMYKCILFLGTISIALALVKMFTSFVSPKRMLTVSDFCRPEGRAAPEGYNPVRVAMPKFEGYNPPQIKSVKFEGQCPKAEGVRDINASEILIKIIRSNMYKIYDNHTNVAIGHVLFLRGKVCLMPRHYLEAFKQSVNIKSDNSIRFESVFLERAFDIKTLDLIEHLKVVDSPLEGDVPVKSRDLMVGLIPTAIFHSDATPYFLSVKTLQYVERTHAVLPVLVENNYKGSRRPIVMFHYTEGKSVLQRIEELPVTNADDVVVRYIRNAWSYNMDTKMTECGAPLIARNPQLAPGKICGIHVAGIEGAGLGYSTPVYKEDVELILQSFSEENLIKLRQPELDDYPTQQCQVPEDGEFLRIGSIKKRIAQPSKSKIIPSLVHNKIRTPLTKPCCLNKILVDGVEFNPRSYRIGRLGNVPTVIPEELIYSVKEAFISEMKERMFDIPLDSSMKAEYTVEEAILGIDGADYVQSIKRTTSPGFPYVQMYGFETRKKIFGDGELIDLSRSEARVIISRVKYIIDRAKENEALPHFFLDTLKDERKPIFKAHKTRLFSAGPLDYLIACKMYFNGIIALLQKSRNVNHISVGSNPYSQDWGQIVKVLENKSKHMIAGDFEGFDASQHQRLLEASMEVLIQLSKHFLNSNDEQVRIMRVLSVGLFNSFHITGNEVYQWTHSLPSGHYLTATLNSVFVNLAFSAAWSISNKKISYKSARSFWKQCGIVANGDDHIVSVPYSKLHVFNQMTLPSIFKEIGLGYTMEDKEAVVTERSRNINEISYLKRGFKYWSDENRWLAPLSLDVILETPMWIHKCPDEGLQTIANLEWALKELSLYDEEWDEWSGRLLELLSELGCESEFKDKLDVRRLVLETKLEM